MKRLSRLIVHWIILVTICYVVFPVFVTVLANEDGFVTLKLNNITTTVPFMSALQYFYQLEFNYVGMLFVCFILCMFMLFVYTQIRKPSTINYNEECEEEL